MFIEKVCTSTSKSMYKYKNVKKSFQKSIQSKKVRPRKVKSNNKKFLNENLNKRKLFCECAACLGMRRFQFFF